MKKTIFTLAGTTDPIRGEHDGPLLHILRYYRPDNIYLVATPEIKDLNSKDNRFEKIKEYLKEKWNYNPSITISVLDELKDPSNLDELDNFLFTEFKKCLSKFPDDEIIINISSGTPQIKMILYNIASDVRYKSTAVQVKNFEHAAGTSERTAEKNYDIECQIAFNEDDNLNAENRCVEPRLFAVKRQNAINQIRTLLNNREFQALAEIKDLLPVEVHPLVDHLSERSQLNWQKAIEIAKRISLDFELYPKTKDELATSQLQQRSYREISEYILIVRNLQKSGKLSEFILRLEPLIAYLQRVLVDTLLNINYGFKLDDFTAMDGKKFFPEKLKECSEEFYSMFVEALGSEPKEGPISTFAMDKFLQCFTNVPREASNLFNIYGKIKDTRNSIAHQLNVVTEKEIKKECGKSSAEIVSQIERATQVVFPQCNPQVFNVYDKCINYIIQKL